LELDIDSLLATDGDSVMFTDFLLNVLRFGLLFIVRPILKCVATVTTPVYRGLFGWFDDRMYSKLQRNLEHDIVGNLPWLLEIEQAKVVRNTSKYPKAFDYAIVTMAAGTLLLRFVRGRGEFRVDVAPQHAPDDWQELAEAIASIDESKTTPHYYRFKDLNLLLKAHWNELKYALSEAQYGAPRRRQSAHILTPL